MDWLDLLAVQGTLKSLLQHHSSKASILRCSALFTVQLSHPYMTTGKTIALTRWTLMDKLMSLAFQYAVQVGHNFPSKESASFNFMAAITICSDFGAPQNNTIVRIYYFFKTQSKCHFLCKPFKALFSLLSPLSIDGFIGQTSNFS